MKNISRLILIAMITFAFGVATVFVFWSVNWSSPNKNVIANSTSSLQASNGVSLTQTSYAINPNDLETVKKYAESYEPKSTKNQAIPSPPYPNEKVMKAINALSSNQSREHERYIILIFLRIYRFHLEHFQQSYDLVDIPENSLTNEFYRLIGVDPHKEEMTLSSLAPNWVRGNPKLLEYDLIKKEMTRIDNASKRNRDEFEKQKRIREKKAESRN